MQNQVEEAMGLIETWGRGTNNMIEQCEADGLPAPVFNELTGGVGVTFRFAQMLGSTSEVAKSDLDLASRQHDILMILQTSAALKLSDIRSKLVDPPSERMVRKDLDVLRTLGLVKLRGHGKSAVWVKK